MHVLKYQAQKELGVLMGQMAARELVPSGFFSGMDTLIPIPIHPAKQKKRGYNQAEMIAKGIGSVTEIPVVNDILLKVAETESQTKKGRLQRYENIKRSFDVMTSRHRVPKNVLLIDDVITTGSTIEAAGQLLKEAFDCKLNVLTLAATD